MKLVSLLISLFFLVFFPGCSANTLPSCADEPVKKLVKDMAAKELFKGMLLIHLPGQSSKIKEEVKDTEVYKDFKKQDQQGEGFAYGIMTVENFLKFVPISKAAAEVKSTIDSQISQLNISVNNIRTNNNNKNNKLACEATLDLSNGKSFPITYTAQSTEDKKIWVEVFGL